MKTSARLLTILPAAALILCSVAAAENAERVFRVGDKDVTAPAVVERPRGGVPAACKKGHEWENYLFIYEVKVDAAGHGEIVKTLNAPRITPPCPDVFELHKREIADAKFKPGTYKGKPAAVIFVVTIQYDPRS